MVEGDIVRTIELEVGVLSALHRVGATCAHSRWWERICNAGESDGVVHPQKAEMRKVFVAEPILVEVQFLSPWLATRMAR